MTRILINKCNDILRAGQRTVFTDEPLEIEYMENEFLNLEWILKGSDESQKFDINKEFGNTDVKLVSAEISAHQVWNSFQIIQKAVNMLT